MNNIQEKEKEDKFMNKRIKEKRKEYRDVLKEREVVLDKLSKLNQNEIIKEYKRLIDENNNLYNKENKLYKELKFEEYKSCEHVLVNSLVDCEEGYGGRTIRYKGCIKCGCNEYVKEKKNCYLSPEEKAMLSYLDTIYYGKLDGKDLRINCDDFEETIKKYKILKRTNKDIDEDTLLEMLKSYIKSQKENAPQRVKDKYTVNIWDVP